MYRLPTRVCSVWLFAAFCLPLLDSNAAAAKIEIKKSNRTGTKIVQYRANPRKHLPRSARSSIVCGVMGGAGSKTTKRVRDKVKLLGKTIGEAGAVLLTGACPGLPDDAARSARKVGGYTLGISPFSNLESHVKAGSPTSFDVLQLTRLPDALRGQERPNFMGREIDNIVHSDVILIVGGRSGTLGEFAIAFEESRPIGVLTKTGGVADQCKTLVKAIGRAGKKPKAPVIFDSDPKRLVHRLLKAYKKMDKDDRGPLGDGDV